MKKNTIEEYSMLRKIRSEGRSSAQLEQLLSTISLEDLISLKLELLSRLTKGKMYGLRLYDSMPYIAKDAVVKYAFSVCKNRKEVAGLLGISYVRVKKIEYQKKLKQLFSTEKE
tara:strand:- start:16511 stop:16852 length:342 start_codon:yes stop_codon:yes gene_type:complete